MTSISVNVREDSFLRIINHDTMDIGICHQASFPPSKAIQYPTLFHLEKKILLKI